MQASDDPTEARGTASGSLERPRVEAYRLLAEVAPLAEQLEALNLSSRRPSPFDSFAYIKTFADFDEYVVPGQETLFLIAFDGDSPVGYLPLRKVPERLLGVSYNAIRFFVSHDSDRPRAVARPEDEARCCEAFYRYLIEAETDWSLMLLHDQDTASGLYQPPAIPGLERYYVRHFPNNPNGTIPLPYNSLDEYLHAFNKSHRRHLEQAVRKLASAGDLEVVSSSDPSSRRDLFELYLEVDRLSWKAKVGGHIGRHPRRRAFFRSLLDTDRPMQMLVQVLLLNGAPVAGMVSGIYQNRLYALEEGFDEACRDLSPGNAMMLLFVREAIERGCEHVNMLGNYAYYKSLWHATITETAAVQLFRKGSLVHLKAVAGEIKRKLRPPVTQRDLDFNLARKDAGEPGEAKPERPSRIEERERAAATLRRLEETGATFDRLAGDALERALPFTLRRGKAGGKHEEEKV
ncbi:MAG: GNAT family N-acetyltransferase [Polyangiaceae bacterium]|nr:GNAT family N-acetyltransferase [Polyangiaceae bacterium]